MDKQKHNIIAKRHRDRKREYYKNLEKENKILKETLKKSMMLYLLKINYLN